MLITGGQTHGLVMGRFMPPHNGHRYLIEFARRFADRVTVLVCTLSHEPIPGGLRYQWMRELFPELNVVHVTEEIPEAGRSNPEAHKIWARFIRRRLDRSLHYVFASETYGGPLATELGARFIPVDPARSNFPISASAIRESPAEHWRYIPGPVRPYFQKRVCLIGGSAAERRELTVRLAAEFGTLAVPDVRTIRDELLGSSLLDASQPAGKTGYRIDPGDELELLQSQRAAEAALARQAGPVLVCAADALVIALASASSAGSTAGPASASTPASTAAPASGSASAPLATSGRVSGSAPADLYMALPARDGAADRMQSALAERNARVETLPAVTSAAAIECLRRFLHEHP